MEIRYIDDIVILEPSGKISLDSSDLIETIAMLIDKGKKKIVLDFHNITVVDYNGLSVICIAFKRVLNNKGEMKLCDISENIAKLLEIVKLDDVLDIYVNLKDAIASFKETEGSDKSLGESPLRRRFKRLLLDIPVYYRLSKSYARKGAGELKVGRIANLSAEGLFIRTIDIYPQGSDLEIEIPISETGKNLIFKGIVLWDADKTLQKELYPGMGIGFVNISKSGQDTIIRFIDKNLVRRQR